MYRTKHRYLDGIYMGVITLVVTRNFFQNFFTNKFWDKSEYAYNAFTLKPLV